jgi:hypothetical protein
LRVASRVLYYYSVILSRPHILIPESSMRALCLGLCMATLSFLDAAAQVPTGIVAHVSVLGFARADSGRVDAAIRSGLQRDSLFHIVYRPPRDSARFARGRELEVAPLTITAAVRQVGRDLFLDVTAVQAVSKIQVLQTTITTPSGSAARPTFVENVVGSFAQQLALLTR